jgi:membrane-associated phospholipid phosphatase
MPDQWLQWGCEFVVWVQSLPDWLTPIMLFFSFLGTIQFYLVVLPFILWCLDVGVGLRLGALLLTSGLVNGTLKAVFGWPRPYWVCPRVDPYTTDSSFGLPSGHAQNSLSFWGRTIAFFPGLGSVLLGLLLIFLISTSRIYLGVHFPFDTLVGWGFGLAILLLFLLLEKPIVAWLKGRKLATQLLSVVLFGLLLLSLSLAISWLAYRPVPAEWIAGAATVAAEEPIDPRNPLNIIAAAGTLLGLSLGGVLLQNWGGFSAKGVVWKRLLRYLLGIVGAGFLFFVLGGAFETANSVPAYIGYYLLFVFLGFWITYISPRIFVLVKLA